MSGFRFKRFSVANDRAAMKVNTDGVVLGTSAGLRPSDRRILDIGTGTGIIALMLAQRLSDLGNTFGITGIDIDADSAGEAASNFAASPWAGSLRAECCALQDFRPEAGEYDLIVSNPPFYDDSLTNPDARKCQARHTGSLPHGELAAFAAGHLSREGRISVIIPEDVRETFCRTLRASGLYPFRVLKIRGTAAKPYSRAVVEAGRTRPGVLAEESLTIREGDGWTAGYLTLTKEFHPFA